MEDHGYFSGSENHGGSASPAGESRSTSNGSESRSAAPVQSSEDRGWGSPRSGQSGVEAAPGGSSLADLRRQVEELEARAERAQKEVDRETADLLARKAAAEERLRALGELDAGKPKGPQLRR